MCHPCQAAPKPQAVEMAASQTEVEELNERLFELRVEVQNLAEDNSISLASITRKVMLKFIIQTSTCGRYVWPKSCLARQSSAQGTAQKA